MKEVTAKKLRKADKERLHKILGEAQSHLQELQFRLAANQLSDVREYRKTRKQIARIKTVLREKAEEDNNA